MRTSLAEALRYICSANCGARRAHDLKGLGFVRHLERPTRENTVVTSDGYCALDRGGKDERPS